MTKKNYQKPTMEVAEMWYEAHILVDSNTKSPKTLRGESDDYKELG